MVILIQGIIKGEYQYFKSPEILVFPEISVFPCYFVPKPYENTNILLNMNRFDQNEPISIKNLKWLFFNLQEWFLKRKWLNYNNLL